MDLVGLVLLRGLVAEALDLRVVGDIGDMRRDPQSLRQAFLPAQPLGFGQSRGRDIAGGDAEAFGHELAHQLASHARTAAGDDGDPACEVLHSGYPCVRAA